MREPLGTASEPPGTTPEPLREPLQSRLQNRFEHPHPRRGWGSEPPEQREPRTFKIVQLGALLSLVALSGCIDLMGPFHCEWVTKAYKVPTTVFTLSDSGSVRFAPESTTVKITRKVCQ